MQHLALLAREPASQQWRVRSQLWQIALGRRAWSRSGKGCLEGDSIPLLLRQPPTDPAQVAFPETGVVHNVPR